MHGIQPKKFNCKIEKKNWTYLKSLRPSIELLGSSLMKYSSKLTFEDWHSWVRGWEGDSVLSHILQNK